MNKTTGTIRQKIVLPAPPEVIYRMLMDPSEHAKFTGAEASGSSEVGETFHAWDGYITAKNVKLERDKRIEQEWSTTGWPDGLPPSHLIITLKKVDEGTELELVQTGVPEDSIDEYAQGWQDYYWAPMHDHLKK